MELQLSVPPEELTRAEQKILDFINTNTDSFLFLTIGQLAQRLDLSDATVSRFARHAGCRDFKALKARVLEQATGPAVKMAGTLRQGCWAGCGNFPAWTARFPRRKLPPGWSSSRPAWKRRPSSSPRRPLTRRSRPFWRPGGCGSTGRTPPAPWPSYSTSACGGWGCR